MTLTSFHLENHDVQFPVGNYTASVTAGYTARFYVVPEASAGVLLMGGFLTLPRLRRR